jgi:hypothetical protein
VEPHGNAKPSTEADARSHRDSSSRRTSETVPASRAVLGLPLHLRGVLHASVISVQAPQPPQLEPQWSTWIVIIAVLFLIAVFAFYFYVH